MTDNIYQISLEKRVIRFIENTPKKHQLQIKRYILNLQENPTPHDSKILINYEPYRRGDCGEYRIVFRVDEENKTVYVILVGKRNGSELYQHLKRIF